MGPHNLHSSGFLHLRGRSSQSDTTPNLILGPGGQASFAPQQGNVPQQEASPVVPQNQAPQQIQSLAHVNETPVSSGSQPLQVSPSPYYSSPQVSSKFQTPLQTLATIQSMVQVSSSSQYLVTTSGPTQTLIVTSITVLPGSITPSSAPLLTTVSNSTLLEISTSAVSSSASASSPVTSAIAIAASTSENADTSQTLSPAQTGLPSASATPSDLSVHGAPFYVGVVLGTIFVISCLAALIAWWIRLRLHAKRRRALGATNVPWANSHDGSDGLEEGRETEFVGSRAVTPGVGAIGGLSSQEQFAQAQSWEPRGDRDVGEPKRSESFLNTPISPTRGPMSSQNPFSEGLAYPTSNPHLADSLAYPLPIYTGPCTTPDYGVNGSIDDHGSTHTLGPLQVANMMPGDSSAASSRAGTALGTASLTAHTQTGEFGTPREDMSGSRPRFLSLNGEGLRVPWRGLSVRRSRGGGGGKGGGGSWDPLPMPGGSQVGDEGGWTESLRSNLVHAFNAVAANINPYAGEETPEDRLTPTPARTRGADRKSLRKPDWQNFVGGELVGQPLTREGTMVSASSKAWTLEDTGNGAGIVHFRVPGLQGYGGGDHAFSPQMTSSSLAVNGRCAIGTDIFRASTHESQTPLLIAKHPKAALVKPDLRSRVSQYGRALAPRTRTEILSRASSVYSTASASPSVFVYRDEGRVPPDLPCLPPTSRTSTTTVGSRQNRRRSDQRPNGAARSPSFNCSVVSYGSSSSRGTDWTGNEEATRALKDRRGKAARA